MNTLGEKLKAARIEKKLSQIEVAEKLLVSRQTISKWETILDKGIMPSEKVLDFPVDCNTLTGSVNL